MAVAYLLLLSLIAFGVPLAISLGDRVNSEVKAQARDQADLVAASAPALLEHSQRAILQRLVSTSARSQRGRVVVVDGAGRVIADSSGPGELGANYASRPEIAAALRGRTFQGSRHSQTLGTEILATAVPILRAGRPVGAVRVTQSTSAVTSATRRSIVGLVVLGAVVLLLGAIAGGLIARQTSRPIRRLEEAARRVEEGDLRATAPVEGSSEQRSLAQSFNRMTGRLGRLLRGQQNFVADASHQLRTPLTGVRLQLEELREDAREGGRTDEIDAGIREVDRLSEIIDDLLILSRAGEREAPGEEFDVAVAADQARERWEKTAGEAGLELTRETTSQSDTCWCARADFDRALDVLIENAVRYSPGGSEVRIVTGPGRVEVLDSGPGLQAGEEEAIFERFHRGSASGRVQGTGLGLPIARELAEVWGGSVTVENRDEHGGARAVIWLPAHPIAVGTGGEPT